MLVNVVVSPHWDEATARFCTTPQSPVPLTNGMLGHAAAISSPGVWAVISLSPWEYVDSPVPSLIEMTLARWCAC